MYPETDYRLGQRARSGLGGLGNQNSEYQRQAAAAQAASISRDARNQEQYSAMYRNGIGGQQRTYSPPPAIAPPPNHWSITLGVSAKATISEIKAAYRRLAGTAHPDHGGSSDAMAKLNDARDRALRERKAA